MQDFTRPAALQKRANATINPTLILATRHAVFRTQTLSLRRGAGGVPRLVVGPRPKRQWPPGPVSALASHTLDTTLSIRAAAH